MFFCTNIKGSCLEGGLRTSWYSFYTSSSNPSIIQLRNCSKICTLYIAIGHLPVNMDRLSNSSKNRMKKISRGQNVETLIILWHQNCLWPNVMHCIFLLRIQHILMTKLILIFLVVPAKHGDLLLPSVGSSFGFQQCLITVTGLGFE